MLQHMQIYKIAVLGSWRGMPKNTCISYKKSLKIPKGNQNPYIEEEQTTQWPKEKV
jgi:hypothetical protein